MSYDLHNCDKDLVFSIYGFVKFHVMPSVNERVNFVLVSDFLKFSILLRLKFNSDEKFFL